MKEIQPYQSPTRQALEVTNRGRLIKGIGQTVPAGIEVYGSYVAVDSPETGYSVAVVPTKDADRLKSKQPISPGDFWAKTVLGELLATLGLDIYDMTQGHTYISASDLLVGGGILATGALGAATERARRMRAYRRSATLACNAANQTFIPNIPVTFPDLPAETRVPYGEDNQVAYGELWSAVAKVQQEINSPKPEDELPPRQLHAANLMRGMVANFWSDEGRREFLSTAIEPWTALKPSLERLRVYEGGTDTSEGLKKAYQPQVIRTAGHIAGIMANFLDARGIELHGSANQQQTTADTQHILDADIEVIKHLTTQGVVSRVRADVVLSVDAAYRHG